MIKWTITYDTYNGDTITEDFYFNLNKAELIQMQFDVNGSYRQFLERVANEHDYKSIGEQYKNIILNSYGKKSDDGKQFRKSEKIREDFEYSEAYSSLYMELLNDQDKMAKFVKGILPKDLQGEITDDKIKQFISE